MKILTATTATQGERANDFGWTIEGELVWIGLICARDRRDPDGGCGCGRAFSGMSSHRATTTAMVSDLPLSPVEVATAVAGYYESAGYGVFSVEQLAGEVAGVLGLAASWDVGEVIERRLDEFGPRHVSGIGSGS